MLVEKAEACAIGDVSQDEFVVPRSRKILISPSSLW